MAVPKRKTSPSKRNARRSHIKDKQHSRRDCPTSGVPGRPHHVSPSGHYNGRQVTDAKVNV